MPRGGSDAGALTATRRVRCAWACLRALLGVMATLEEVDDWRGASKSDCDCDGMAAEEALVESDGCDGMAVDLVLLVMGAAVVVTV